LLLSTSWAFSRHNFKATMLNAWIPIYCIIKQFSSLVDGVPYSTVVCPIPTWRDQSYIAREHALASVSKESMHARACIMWSESGVRTRFISILLQIFATLSVTMDYGKGSFSPLKYTKNTCAPRVMRNDFAHLNIQLDSSLNYDDAIWRVFE